MYIDFLDFRGQSKKKHKVPPANFHPNAQERRAWDPVLARWWRRALAWRLSGWRIWERL